MIASVSSSSSSSERALCFDAAVFQGEGFDVDAFIADCRSRIPLESVLADLSAHGERLRAALLAAANAHFGAMGALSAALAAAGDGLASAAPALAAAQGELDAWLATAAAAAARLSALETAAADTRARRAALCALRGALEALSRFEALCRLRHASTTEAETGDDCECEEEEEEDAATAAASLERAAHIGSALSWTLSDGPLRGTPLAAQLRDRHTAAAAALRARTEAALLAGLRMRDAELCCAALRTAVAAGDAALPATVFRARVVRPFVARTLTADACAGGAAAVDAALCRVLRWAETGDVAFLCAAQRAVGGGVDFGFLAALWAEADDAIAAAAPGLSSPALPDAFHAGYRAVAVFVGALEAAHCADAEELRRFREKAAGAQAAMDRRWNTKLYFHLRMQEISSRFEGSLSQHRRVQLASSSSSHRQQKQQKHSAAAPVALSFASSRVLWECLCTCFDAETTFLPPIAAHFVRLALQLVARFSRWICDGAAQRGAGATATEEPWASMSPSDFVHAHRDARTLAALVGGLEMRRVVDDCAAKCFPGVVEDFSVPVFEALRCGAAHLAQAAEASESVFVNATAVTCSNALKQMYGTMSAVRDGSGSKKGGAQRPSFFISRVFEPLSTLLDGAAGLSTETERSAWARKVTSAVFDKATEICGELMLTAFRTDDVMLKMSEPSPTSAGGAAPDSGDTDRFLAQLAIDVAELGRSAMRFGVDASSSESFQRLSRTVIQH